MSDDIKLLRDILSAYTRPTSFAEQKCAKALDRLETLEDQLAEKEVFVCPECQHMFPYKNLGVPCPHCAIEELEAKIEKVKSLCQEDGGIHGDISAGKIEEILGEEEEDG